MPEIYDELRTRGKPFRFRPPLPHSGLIRLAKRFSHRFLWDMLKVTRVEVSADDLQRVRSLAGQRVVLAPNHPSWEPLVLFELSRQLDMEFNYLCAKEVFLEPPAVIRPWFLQRMGAYSIVRGTADREALRTTRELLLRGERFLVLFPEGEVCWQNDVLLPFQQGAAQMAFWALDDLAKQHEPEALPPLFFVPLAVKYFYQRDMGFEIEASLARLERQLGLGAKLESEAEPAADQRYARLLRIGEAVLGLNEQRYGLKSAAGSSMNQRIAEVREKILSRIAASLGVKQDPGQPLRDRIRSLFNALDALLLSAATDGETAYSGRMGQSRVAEAEQLSRELWRVMHFIAVQGDYVGQLPSTERYLDTLGRLEQEVLGRPRIWGPRTARLRIGEAIDLREFHDLYRGDKRAALASLTGLLEQRVRDLLQQLVGASQVLHAPPAGPQSAPPEPAG